MSLHDDVIRRTGGATGILQQGSLRAGIDRANFGPFHGRGSLSERTALLVRAIAQDHPFVDGNKRTGLAILETIVGRNGSRLRMTNLDALEFVLRVARVEMDISEITRWIRARIRKV